MRLTMAAIEVAISDLFDANDGVIAWGPDQSMLTLKGILVPVGTGLCPDGTGEEFLLEPGGSFIWYLLHNCRDADDWTLNNIHTPWGGAIGRRYEATLARLSFLKQLSETNRDREASRGVSSTR